MKLYATVTSERASKGQGGNEFIRIELQGNDGVALGHIELRPSGHDYGLNIRTPREGASILIHGEDLNKGNKQKGETAEAKLVRKLRECPHQYEIAGHCTDCGAKL